MPINKEVYSKYFGDNWTIYEDTQKLKEVVVDILTSKINNLYLHTFKSKDNPENYYSFITDNQDLISTKNTKVNIIIPSGYNYNREIGKLLNYSLEYIESGDDSYYVLYLYFLNNSMIDTHDEGLYDYYEIVEVI